MAVTTTLLRTMARQYGEPDQILRAVNEALAIQNPRGMFVTLVCLIVDPASGQVRFANGGHPPGLLVGAGAPLRWALHASGMMAGVLPEIEFGGDAVELQPGETLILYTDGVTEAFAESGEMFGEEGLERCFQGAPGANAEESIARLFSAVQSHARGAPQSDDITVIALRRTATV
jgi:sigma-B regulation protein RsbU (phosphoserine phosphatase)